MPSSSSVTSRWKYCSSSWTSIELVLVGICHHVYTSPRDGQYDSLTRQS